MRLTYLAYSFSLSVMYFSFVLLIPIAVALFYHETNAIFPFLIAATTAFMTSVTLKKVVRGASHIKSINDIKKSEGLWIVTFSWLFAGMFAAIPYLFFGISPINALFEAVSGITTTGASDTVIYRCGFRPTRIRKRFWIVLRWYHKTCHIRKPLLPISAKTVITIFIPPKTAP